MFLRCERTSFRVKQERRWLCQPAVTPITAIRGGTRRYFLSDVLRAVHVRVRYRPTVVAHVQPTFDTVSITLATTVGTRFRGISLGYLLNGDAFHLGFVFEQVDESVERPRVQVEVAVFAPVLRLVVLLILADTGEVAHHNRPNTFLDTPLNDVFREGVEVVGAASRLLLL